MDDLISRAAAIDVINTWGRQKNVEARMGLLYRDLYAIPAVDAAPVVYGRWVKVPGYATPGGDPVWRCSECGKGVHVYGIEHGTYGAEVADGQWVSCPNCSARMDGEHREAARRE